MKTNAARLLDTLGVAYRRFAFISISAGMRGVQLLVAPDDYARAVKATYAAIAR